MVFRSCSLSILRGDPRLKLGPVDPAGFVAGAPDDLEIGQGKQPGAVADLASVDRPQDRAVVDRLAPQLTGRAGFAVAVQGVVGHVTTAQISAAQQAAPPIAAGNSHQPEGIWSTLPRIGSVATGLAALDASDNFTSGAV